jgi:tRNA 2-thiouridine synthesizing protein E
MSTVGALPEWGIDTAIRLANMAPMEVAFNMPLLDADGYLVDPALWTEAIAVELARREGIELGSDHWDAIRFMRRYWEEHQIAADARFVIRHLMARLGPGARNRLFELFPYGYPGQACRIAGMKRPRAWSTG